MDNSYDPNKTRRLLQVACILYAAVACTTSDKTLSEPTSAKVAAHERSGVVEWGRAAHRQFMGGELEALHQKFHRSLQEQVPLEALREIYDDVRQQLGAESNVEQEEVLNFVGMGRAYYRDSIYEKLDDVVMFVAMFEGDGKIVQFGIQPKPEEAESPYLNYESKTDLVLPFTGEWYVFWGGRDVRRNYHAATNSQRFALDLLIVRNGTSHDGDGRDLTDYHCFGQPILAPGAGRAVAVVDRYPDQPIGSMDSEHPTGNHVIIDHGNGEFSLLAHLKSGSVAVEEGQKVTQGDPIGECGNSGNTSEPHLHYHLQDGLAFPQSTGMPAKFRGYIADGRPVERGEPLFGQKVRAE